MTTASPRSDAEYNTLALGHRPGLDGLRGWAVIAVVAFHSGVLHAGWVGVDVFMALSGYLITGVLLKDLGSPQGLRLGHFWMRRARRLLPGLVVLLAAVAVLSVVAPHGWPTATRRETLGALTYSTNWLRISNRQSYWELFTAPSALDHLWSLAIEEQFYLVWPLVVLAAWRFRRRQGVIWIAGVAIAGLAWWQIWLAGHGASIERIYVGTDTRAPAFLLGAVFMALMSTRQVRGETARWCTAAALVVIAVSCVTLDGQAAATYQGPLLVVSLAGAIAATGAARLDGSRLLDRLLTGRLIGLVGRWSYGIYLFHWPIVVLMQPNEGLAFARFCVVLGASILIAATSYHVFEHPVLNQSLRGWQRPTVIMCGFAVFVTVVVVARVPIQEVDAATAAALRAPLPSAPARLTTPNPEDSPPTSSSVPNPVTATTATTANTATASSVATVAETTPTTGARRQRILVVGDSVVYGLREQFVSLGAKRDLDVAVRAAPGCTMSARPEDQNNLFATDLCSTIRLSLRDDVTRFQPDRVVAFLGGMWNPFRWQGQAFDPCSTKGQAAMAEAGDQYLADLTANGASIALVIPPKMGGDYGASAPDAAPCYAQAYSGLQTRWAQAVTLEPADTLICPVAAATCLPDVGGVVVRSDGLHFTKDGGELIISWLFQRMNL